MVHPEVKYDSCGNMTYGPLDGKMVQYTYDCRNRLVKAENTSYGYDGDIHGIIKIHKYVNGNVT